MKRQTILIIDDDNDLRYLLGRMAGKLGYQCHILMHSRDAMRELDHSEFDAVVTDIFMPGTSGLDVIAQMKEKHPNIPIVAMSAGWERGGGSADDALLAAKKIGADEVLQKPFTREELDAALKRAIASKR